MLVIAIFIVLTIGSFAFFSGYDQRSEQARVLKERLLAFDNAARRPGNHDAALLRDEMLSSVPALERVLAQSAQMRSLQAYIDQAGMKTRAGKLVLIAATAGSVAALIVQLIAGGASGLLALLIGCAIPFLVVARKRSNRFKRFEELFPYAAELLARAIRAGHSFSSSLEVIADELSEPVSGEFRKLYEEQKYGLPLRDAMLNFAERIPLVDVRFFAASILLQRETGGNLAEILDKLSYVIRERFKIHRQVLVYTAQGRMSMIVLMALPFVMVALMSFFAPNYLHVLLTDPWGRNLVVLGLAMMAMGYYFIRQIVHIKV